MAVVAEGPEAQNTCPWLSREVVPEAQIAAVYTLYTLYYTQPSKPRAHIYVSPNHQESLLMTATVRL
jgi:hypothetical protein